jgi:hypothetical protein
MDPFGGEGEVLVHAGLEGQFAKVLDMGWGGLGSDPKHDENLGQISGDVDHPVSFPGEPETNIYYHVNKARAFLASAPFNYAGLDGFQVRAEYDVFLDIDYCISHHCEDWIVQNAQAEGDMNPPKLLFGAFTNYALSPDVIVHEYAHLVIHSIYGQIGSSGTLGYDGDFEATAMNEGLADYWAAAINGDNDGCVGCNEGLPFAGRDLEQATDDRRFDDPSEFGQQVGAHDSSRVISGALWDMRDDIGGNKADLLTFKALQSHPTSFADLLQRILEQDHVQFACADVNAIKNAFAGHAISASMPPSCLGTVTDIGNPDAYSCSQPGYVDFEGFPEGTNLSSGTVSGVQFTTTGGYTWLVGDFATGRYNGKYPNGAYTSHGTHWAWLGVSQGSGRIDFPKGPASYFSLLVSDYTPVYLDAYNASGNLLATAGPAPTNISTGHMTELKITRATRDMAYVIVHDAADYFEIDDVCTNAPATPNTIKRVLDNPHWMETGDHAFGSFIVDFVQGTRQFLRIFVGPFFSDVDLILTRPDGSIVSPDDPGVTYNETGNSLEFLIDGAQPGEWRYEIVANELPPGGENIHIFGDQETILVSNEPPTLTAPGEQQVQYSDWLAFGVSATDPDDPPESLRFSATALCDGLALIDHLDGTASVEGTVQSGAGTCNAEITVTDPDGLADSDTVPIVVSKEEATLAYTGDALVTAGSPITLDASVNEAADGSPGDITKAAVFFDVTAGIGGGTTTYGAAPVSAGGEATWTFPTGLPANVYSVDVRMDPGNAYYHAAPAHTAALVVYDPSAGFTTGGGWVMDGGAKGNFGFNAKYAGKQANIQGQANYVYRSGAGVTQVKSSAMQWLVISGNTAVFRGQATVNGAGNHIFEITVVDNGEPGVGDTFAIRIWRPDGSLLHEIPPTVLGGGNVVVPHPKGR